MADDATVLTADGLVHLLPSAARLTFCGREPTTTVTLPATCRDCGEMAAARDTAQARTPR